MEKRWVFHESAGEERVQKLSNEINISPALANLLIQRGVNDFEEAKCFFRPSLKMLHDPFLMKDMDHAVNRLILAMERTEKILIYGDYDVDGTTSVALTYGFLHNIYEYIEYYIPDRYKEGYGISEEGIQYAADNDFSLIISLDCGIRAVGLINEARKRNIDFIICDHHRPGDQLPPAHAILNPKQDGCNYPFKELCGCGVGFKLLHGLCVRTKNYHKQLVEWLDLVAVAIAADIVPITGENRILSYFGLQRLNGSPRPGLKALAQLAGLKSEINIENIVFGFAPRINAAGRMEHARAAVQLLLADTDDCALKMANELNIQNTERRGFDTHMTQEALEMIEQNEAVKQTKTTVLFKNDWHKGVVGIVASRCIEKYYRPTIILTESHGKASGSARSVDGFDVYAAIDACSDLLEQFGGHKYAAGLTLPLDNIPLFQKRFEEIVSTSISEDQLIPLVNIDVQIKLSDVGAKFFNVIKQLAPFGPGNMRPVFMSDHLMVYGYPQVLKEQHLKFSVRQEGNQKVYNAIGFGMAHYYETILEGKPFKMAYNVEENHYNGNTSLQLMIRDIKPME
ncbi:single-stranded-DNA-specific exonuclease RecJ [Catalinimonas niigatensis]|uniref:single-stranded-DNA-specific exonuclease RecJ n=1 Tax=Catalinimonas niigatensis TaxID=1397264 RepID=UPI0026671F2B|nr:single-stranded-DNA-specific exonuclease RecJ [Catalinimonas niigatensis]WPP53366.1 single-stranded-DNA-specific exonuclease RecJ [Catalinimonas niigatensis]